jgi:hypothetical protein
MTRFLSPPQIAKILGIGPEKVLHYIATGELRAINTSLSDRPRWKIDPVDFESWKRGRSNQPKQESTRRRRSIPTATKSYV